MIKKFLLALVMALPLCAWAQAPKFGVVDVQSVLQDMPELKEVDAKIAEASKTYETEYAKIQEEVQKNTPSCRLSARTPMHSKPSKSAV